MRIRKWIGCIAAVLMLCGCGTEKEAPTDTTAAPVTTESQAATTLPTTVPVTTETEPPQTEPPETESTEPKLTGAEAYLKNMTLEEKIGQMFVVAPEQLVDYWQVTVADEQLLEGIRKYHVGGLIYFSENIRDREQITAMIHGTSEAGRVPLFQCVDEEGGMVARVGNNPAMGTTAFPNMMEIGGTGDPENARKVGYTIGSELLELGFNVDFAPVADVTTNPDNRVIGDRAFSTDPDVAGEMVFAAVEGFRESGIVCSLKHFPGHGDTESDSHYGFSATYRDEEELMECEMKPFMAGIRAGAPMVMVGHISAPNVTGHDLPASFSYALVTGLLREKLGYNGIVITDSLQMGAISDHFTSGEAAVAAVEAGVDILLLPNNFPVAYEALLEAVRSGRIPEERIDESVLRILRCKESYGIVSFDSVDAD